MHNPSNRHAAGGADPGPYLDAEAQFLGQVRTNNVTVEDGHATSGQQRLQRLDQTGRDGRLARAAQAGEENGKAPLVQRR